MGDSMMIAEEQQPSSSCGVLRRGASSSVGDGEDDDVVPKTTSGKPELRDSACCKRQLLDSAGWVGRHKRLKPARFLSFHMDILKLLHKDGDDSVDPEIWEMVQKFLKQRERLMESKHQAGAIKAVHSESLRQCEGEAAWMNSNSHDDNQADERNGNNEANSTAATPRNLASYHHGSTSVKPSPVLSHPPFRGSFLLSQSSYSSAAAGRGGGSAEHNNNNNSTHPNNNNHFYIVARLLGRQHQIIESNFYQQAQPFQPLLTSTVTRIGTLQQELHQCQQRRWATHHQRVSEALALGERWSNTGSNSADAAAAVDDPPASTHDAEEDEENERSRIAALESKIRLWSLLVQDLQDAILPDPDRSSTSKED